MIDDKSRIHVYVKDAHGTIRFYRTFDGNGEGIAS